jgi:hypothetical protein
VAADRGEREQPARSVHQRGHGERGSALLLIPAGFVAFLVLAALAFDQSRLFAVRRQLIDVAASAANDAVAAAVDQGAYRAGDGGALAPRLAVNRAETEVAAALAARGLDDVRWTVAVDDGGGPPRVVVRLEADLSTLFARIAPGGYGTTRVAVVSSATFSTF